jgi:hypothetical protein
VVGRTQRGCIRPAAVHTQKHAIFFHFWPLGVLLGRVKITKKHEKKKCFFCWEKSASFLEKKQDSQGVSKFVGKKKRFFCFFGREKTKKKQKKKNIVVDASFFSRKRSASVLKKKRFFWKKEAASF